MVGLMASAASVILLCLLYMWPLEFWLNDHVCLNAWYLGQAPIRVDQGFSNSVLEGLSHITQDWLPTEAKQG